MRYVLTLFLVLFATVTFADARLELSTGTVHAPWSQADADLEYKFRGTPGTIMSLQLANGDYNAFYEQTIEGVSVALVGYPAAQGLERGEQATSETNCGTTAGTFEDENGNAYTTNNCTVIIRYFRPRTNLDTRLDLTFTVLLRNATAATTATAAEVSQAAGESVMFRQY